MRSISGAVRDFRNLDQLARGDTSLHRLDARAKVLATIIFIVAVVSFEKHELSAMVPFFVFPAVMMAQGGLPVGSVARKVAIVIPFAVIVGMFNPLFDREILVRLGPVGISGGWLSWASITVRAILTVGAAIILVGVTGFTAICRALEQLGMPRAFAMQLLFLHRYIFVLTEEGARASRARELRSFGKKGKGLTPFASLVGHLLLRTWLRADRIHMAMLARGFSGEFHTRLTTRFGRPEFLFLAGWASLFIVLRMENISRLVGSLVTRIMP
jgi:cobalt/nickel transport system permease protein